MYLIKLILYSCLLGFSLSEKYRINETPFPREFMFGVATAAPEIEGAWNVDGKSESVWDHWSHNRPDMILDRSNIDVAADSYHKYKTDIELLKDLGVDHYRFSIAWTRILPTGFANYINPLAVEHYTNILLLLKQNNIQPVVTLYSWDHPQALQEAGGWTNEFMVDLFGDYARICFKLFGEHVKYWITLNEPALNCLEGYGRGAYAPGVNLSGITDYMCGHNSIKAHARAWHIYDDEFRETQKGKVAITLDTYWCKPASESIEDRIAAETDTQFQSGWFLHPIFIGDYPKVMKERIAKRSKLEGFQRSRLPTFTQEEIDYIRGTHDFMALNYYSAIESKAIPEPAIGQPSWDKDLGVEYYWSDEWKATQMANVWISPEGFRKVLRWMKDQYNDPEIFITENGVPLPAVFNDTRRISYFQNHLSNLRDAMMFDYVRVIGYTYWTLMDDYEFDYGYIAKFGLYYTNYSSPNRERLPKKSVQYYKHVIRTHRITYPDDDSENEGENTSESGENCED